MKTFILCMGAQKSGTTWLYSQLSQLPNFQPGLNKEYHVLSSIHLKECSHIRNNIFERSDTNELDNARVKFIKNIFSYYDHFSNLLTDEKNLTGDFTPAYSGLSSTVLSNIKNHFDARGVQVKVIFLMREPVTRLESNLRMLRRDWGVNKDLKTSLDYMYSHINQPEDFMRSNYKSIVNNIDSVFDKNDIYYGFYETMFNANETNKILDFLNITDFSLDTKVYVNKSERGSFLYERKDVEYFREQYEDRYEFVKNRFGFDTTLWDERLEQLIQ